MALRVGQVVDDKYEIKRLIGKGGMGNVYEGDNVLIHRRVAIKVLNADVADDLQLVKRFEREAQAAGRIGSDHIVEVLDLGRLPSGERYMVMEYLEGESLRDRMDSVGRMDPEDLFPILVGLLDGLEDAHAAGILHRDLKPANIFLTSDREQPDFVKILDFGVSKFMTLTTDDATTTGQTLGTPRYMAPEQAKGEKDIDFRADIYSVGVIMFRALAARPPYIADTYNELMFKIVLEDPPRLSEVRPDIEPFISDMVYKAMSRERNERYDSVAELAEPIRAWLRERGLEISIRGATRRQRLSQSGVSPRSVRDPEAPTEISTTKHATTMVPTSDRPRRRGWLLAAAALVVGIGGLTSYRLIVAPTTAEVTTPASGIEASSSSATTAEQTATASPEAPSLEPTADATASASAAPTASTTTSASASASAAPPSSAEPATTAPPRPPSWRPPTKPVPKPGGPSRTYRRTL